MDFVPPFIIFTVLSAVLILVIVYETRQLRHYNELFHEILEALTNAQNVVNANAGVQREQTSHIETVEGKMELLQAIVNLHSNALMIYQPILQSTLVKSAIQSLD